MLILVKGNFFCLNLAVGWRHARYLQRSVKKDGYSNTALVRTIFFESLVATRPAVSLETASAPGGKTFRLVCVL